MKRKLRIGVLFGGRSGEHEVSLLSAASILKAIDRRKYDVVPIGINKQGHWLGSSESHALLTGEAPASPGDPDFAISAAVLRSGEALAIPPAGHPLHLLQVSAAADRTPSNEVSGLGLDVVFPVLHGTFGEDGTIQGLFELADVAYVGSGVLGSATGMDKAVMKQLFAAAGLPQTPHLAMLRSEWRADPKNCIRKLERALAYPFFVKPANLGSSVGISKVHAPKELAEAMDLAASYDRKLLIEQGVGGPGAKPRELEVSVLGNDTPEASVVGEIVPAAEFHDYNAKYHSDASVPVIPAKITKAEERRIRDIALAAFRACDCAGLARVDFLMEPRRPGTKPAIFLNEINTMPGFTSISMYPKLWQASGLSYTRLIDRLVELALDRHRDKQQTKFSSDVAIELGG